jgi:2-methylisocitrate lyase-like PEP mutase family enzyme
MTDHADRARRFLELHRAPAPLLLLPNPWDVGSAKLLAWAGCDALATTSSGMAAAAGELDGNVTREAAVAHAHAHARETAAATPLPVNGDLENGFGDGPGARSRTGADLPCTTCRSRESGSRPTAARPISF